MPASQDEVILGLPTGWPAFQHRNVCGVVSSPFAGKGDVPLQSGSLKKWDVLATHN